MFMYLKMVRDVVRSNQY